MAIRILLTPLSWLYGAGVFLRNRYYDRIGMVRRAAVPVISVGNITAGGTGKTPMVIEIVARLRAAGRAPAVLTRGYAARHGQEADEVVELRAALGDVPVIVNADRVAGAEQARRAHGADCVVLDDGFQHRRLGRDVDIVLIDALDPWGGRRLLPAGRLREPLTGLRRASVAIVTRANQSERGAADEIEATLERIAPQLTVLRARIEPRGLFSEERGPAGLSELAGRRVLMVCGLGNPQTFFRSVRDAGGEASGEMVFRDHHRYSRADAEQIERRANELAVDWVVTTRKDWEKLRAAAGAALREKMRRLEVGVVIEGVETLERLIRSCFRSGG